MTDNAGAAPQQGSEPAAGETDGCSCAEARAHLEAFLDHECAADLTARLEAHVRSCAHCSRLADAEQHLRDIVRSRCAEQAPPSLRERVLAQLVAMRADGGVALTHLEQRTTTIETSSGTARITQYSRTTSYRRPGS